jgi:hypothetical protein
MAFLRLPESGMNPLNIESCIAIAKELAFCQNQEKKAILLFSHAFLSFSIASYFQNLKEVSYPESLENVVHLEISSVSLKKSGHGSGKQLAQMIFQNK